LALTAIVWLALFPHSTFGAPETWTDNIKIYKDATTVCPDIRTFTNNEMFPIGVTVEIKRNPSIQILQYYKLSANETDFIVISQGKVTQAKTTYYGLNPGEKLCFTVEAKPMSIPNSAVEATPWKTDGFPGGPLKLDRWTDEDHWGFTSGSVEAK